jgi:hypothetical protein
MKNDHLGTMVTALDTSPTCFERPICRGFTGDWQITGKLGHVLADGDGYLLYVSTEESVRRWTNVKERLISFCRLTQDGDDEGCLHLDRLPTPAEAAIIREAHQKAPSPVAGGTGRPPAATRANPAAH